jgi:ABC-type branched-subunit amino acid transport system substrate-binding protein
LDQFRLSRFLPSAAGRRLAGGALLAVLGLAGCAPQPPRPTFVGIAPPIGAQVAPQPARPAVARVALLLPLSGPQAPLGQAMLNASYLALFDEAPSGVELAPRDTTGTAQGASAAAQAAIQEGAQVLVGPLTSGETAAVAQAARAAGVPVLAFTNDTQRAAPGLWPLGNSPAQQVRRVVQAAAQDGAQRFGMSAPDTEFGRALAAALRGATADLGLPAPVVLLHPAAADPGMAAAGGRGQLARLDAVVLGEAGDRVRRFLAGWAQEGALPAAPDAPASQPGAGGPLLLGTAQWIGDAAAAAEPALRGSRFAGPDGQARARFEARYREAFQETPPRLAAIAYDATALGVRTAVMGGRDPAATTGSAPFAGADGPVRLLGNGQVLRGLGLYTITEDGQIRQIEPGPPPAGVGF